MPFSTRFYLYGYKRASQGLRNLQQALHLRGFRAIRRSPDFLTTPRKTDIVVVWGSSKVPPFTCEQHINTPDKVEIASNKLLSLRKFTEHNVSCPEFTENVEIAKSWLGKSKIVCRTLLTASGGKGIVLASTTEDLVPAPLYVRYMRKQKEYRVHVFKGEVIDVQAKRKQTKATVFDPYIRNHNNGWVFCRDGLEPNDTLNKLAIEATHALELDFGAVDIIYNDKTGKYFVLEVNTAPGLEGTTTNSYAEAFTK